MIFFDTSVLSEFRNSQNKIVCPRKIEFLKSVLHNFHLDISNTFLTEKLFIELIGFGKVRKKIKKENKNHIDIYKKKILDNLEKSEKEKEILIVEYIDFLEDIFDSGLKSEIIRGEIQSITKKSLSEFPFTEPLKFFEENLTKYSEELDRTDYQYNRFIEVITEDTVIRYALDAINIRQLEKNKIEKSLDLLNKVMVTLMLRCRHSEIYTFNLNLLMSALKKQVESKKHQNKLQPLFRIDDDLVDIENGYFPIRGVVVSGILNPVTVITLEPESVVKERLKYNFQAIGVQAENICPQNLIYGRTIILDLEKLTFLEISTGEYIQSTFTFESKKI